MKYKVGDYVRILDNQGQNSLYNKGDIGKIDLVEDDGSLTVEFDNGCSWYVWCAGDKNMGEEVKAEDCFEVCDTLLAPIIERKIKDIQLTVLSIIGGKDYEDDIRPAVDLIDNMLDILKEHGILHELTPP